MTGAIFNAMTKARAKAGQMTMDQENLTTITIKEDSHRTSRNSTKEKDVRKAKVNLPTQKAKVKAKVGEKAKTIKANETTNNSQRVTYLEPPQQLGDDETTVVFKQNMNRISPTTTEAVEQEDNGETNDDNNETTQAYRHGRCGLCDKPVTTINLNPTIELTCVVCE